MKETLGICIFMVAATYGLYAVTTGRPALKLDYWLMVGALIISVLLLAN